ncbi:MAG TPA: hypothetical protein VKD90_26135, partial [Gemmataceae bacterium]|nr:hypothetical protein [Gemmataceae bacterium]
SASAGVPCAILRAGAQKGPPPVFVGQAVEYRPLTNLPHVYLPSGTRLAPPLRRDAFEAALNLSADRVAWLHPLGDGAFRVESLPEAAFQPLQDWVEYRVPEPTCPGRAWVQSRRWEFTPFAERPPVQPEPVPPARLEPQPTSPVRAGLVQRTVGWLRKLRRPPRPLPLSEDISVPVEEALRTVPGPGDRLHRARPEGINKSLERCRELEARFLQALPTLGPREQTAQWAELAAAYDAVGNHPDAALCWLNALWGQADLSAVWAWNWLRAEARAGRPEVKAIDPAPWLATAPGPGTTRAMAAWVVWASLQSPPPAFLAERLADLQARLESHEHWLPVRSAWLTRVAVARLGRVDVLGLARTRDRLSDRLLSSGLSLELDTPSFLRFAGEGVRERFQEARRWLADRRDLIHQWVARLPEDAWVRTVPAADPGPIRRVGLVPDVTHTMAYADLVLAWGLTRFAEHTAADRVRQAAAAVLSSHEPVQGMLREAFEYRIAQVRDGKPPRGPLPAVLLGRIDHLSGLARYAVDKLREHSRVLEPTARVGGYRESIFRKSAVFSASPVAALDGLPADRLDDTVGRLIEAGRTTVGRPHLAEVVAAALDRAAELTDAGIGPVIGVLPDALDATRDQPATAARLIEKGLAAAAQWDRADVARDLAGRFLDLAGGRGSWDAAEAPTGQVVRALRRLGLKADADQVLHQVAERVLHGQAPDRLRAARPAEWPAALRVLLHAAAGWYYAGRDEQAHAVLDEARRDLFAPGLSAKDRTALALAYAATLGQAPVRVALGRLEEVFQRLKGIDVGGSTNAYYSLQPLLLVETAVRAVVSEDFALGPEVRAWLDADELAVRRRIRDELKDVLAGQGL